MSKLSYSGFKNGRISDSPDTRVVLEKVRRSANYQILVFRSLSKMFSCDLQCLLPQKKRHKNKIVGRLLGGGMSQREVARVLKLNRKTVARKFLFMAKQAERSFKELNRQQPVANEVEFDDLETFEHSKCKPLSVTLMVEYKSRRILGFEVSSIPAKGKLAAISRKKYGYMPDHRARGRRNKLVPLSVVSDKN